LVNNDILANEQFGFRANCSTDKAMHKLLDQIQMALNDGHKVGGIFCDLEKAFDCVIYIIDYFYIHCKDPWNANK
jgi:hypothetical protein